MATPAHRPACIVGNPALIAVGTESPACGDGCPVRDRLYFLAAIIDPA
jgi:hypothetical protein